MFQIIIPTEEEMAKRIIAQLRQAGATNDDIATLIYKLDTDKEFVLELKRTIREQPTN